MHISIEVPILTSVETVILENTEVPNPTSAEVPISMEAFPGGSVEAPSLANVDAPLCHQRQAGPLRHLADPEGACTSEERQRGEAGWGEGAT